MKVLHLALRKPRSQNELSCSFCKTAVRQTRFSCGFVCIHSKPPDFHARWSSPLHGGLLSQTALPRLHAGVHKARQLPFCESEYYANYLNTPLFSGLQYPKCIFSLSSKIACFFSGLQDRLHIAMAILSGENITFCPKILEPDSKVRILPYRNPVRKYLYMIRQEPSLDKKARRKL